MVAWSASLGAAGPPRLVRQKPTRVSMPSLWLRRSRKKSLTSGHVQVYVQRVDGALRRQACRL